jgi:hypothetical protein
MGVLHSKHLGHPIFVIFLVLFSFFCSTKIQTSTSKRGLEEVGTMHDLVGKSCNYTNRLILQKELAKFRFL